MPNIILTQQPSTLVRVTNQQTPRIQTAYLNPVSFRVQDATDVAVSNPSDGQFLVWNAAIQKFTVSPSASSNAAGAALLLANQAITLANTANNTANLALSSITQKGNVFQTTYIATNGLTVNTETSLTTYGNATVIFSANTASVGGAGFVQLNDTLISTSITQAATANVAAALNTYSQAVNNFVSTAYLKANATGLIADTANLTANQANATANSALNLVVSVFTLSNSTTNLAAAAFAEANGFQSVINSAFTTANSALNLSISSFARANTANLTANQANVTANSALNLVQSAFNLTNSTTNLVTSAFTEANGFQSIINSSFSVANSALNLSVSAFGVANTANLTANQANVTANSVLNLVQSAFNLTNSTTNLVASVFAEANGFQSVINSAFTEANSAINFATSAYGRANAAVQNQLTLLSSNGITINAVTNLTVIGNNTVLLSANIGNTTQSGIVQLNDTFTSILTTQAATTNVANTIWTTTVAAFTKANSTGTLAQAAFDKANTGGGGTGSGSQTILTANGITVNTGTSLTVSGNNTIVLSANLGNTTQAGIVQLNDTFISTLTTQTATANVANTIWNATKAAYSSINSTTNLVTSVFNLTNSTTDLVVSAFTEANGFQSVINSAFTVANAAVMRIGDTMTGPLIINTGGPGLTTNSMSMGSGTGPKLNLFAASYGIGINSGEWTLWMPAATVTDTTFAVRTGSLTGTYLFRVPAMTSPGLGQGLIYSGNASSNLAGGLDRTAIGSVSPNTGIFTNIISTNNISVTANVFASNVFANTALVINNIDIGSGLTSVYVLANSTTDLVASAFAKANTDATLAQAAFDKANTGGGGTGSGSQTILTANGITVNTGTLLTVSGNNTIVLSANLGNTTQAGIVQLNDTFTSTLTTQAATTNVANTIWTNHQAAFLAVNSTTNLVTGSYALANSTTNLVAAVFAEANGFQSVINSAFTVANSAGNLSTNAYGRANAAVQNQFIVTATGGIAVGGGSAQTSVGNTTIALTANAATTAAVGVVQLNDTFTSTSTTQTTTANVANTIWTNHQAAFLAVNSATNLVAGAYSLANSDANLVASVFAEANGFQSVINSSFTAANSAGNLSSSAFARANAAVQNQFIVTATGGVAVGGGSTTTAVGNTTISLTANAGSTTVVGVVQLNDTFTSTSINQAATANVANTIWTDHRAAFAAVNSTTNLVASAFAEANGFQSVINSSFILANSASNLASSSYARANAAIQNQLTVTATSGIAVNTGSTATVTGNNTIALTANAASTTVAGVVQLNDTFTSTSTSQAATANVANTIWTNHQAAFVAINSATNLVTGAYALANSHTNLVAAVFAEANGFQSIINSSFIIANSASNLASSAYGRANAAIQNQFIVTATSGVAIGGGSTQTAVGNTTIALTANVSSTTQVGVVQLNDTFTSTSTSQATTANVANTIWTTVKAAFAKANTGSGSTFPGLLNVKSFGAFGDGSSHPASSIYGTLGALQVDYPFATALTNQFDWLASQKAVNQANTAINGGTVYAPNGTYLFDKPLVFPTVVQDFYAQGGNVVNLLGDGMGATIFQPTADFGANSAVISCGSPSAFHTDNTGSGSGRYAGNGYSFGKWEDFTVKNNIADGFTFGNAPTISGVPVAMDGLCWAARRYLKRVCSEGFRAGINVVGDHTVWDNCYFQNNQYGVYLPDSSQFLFGDLTWRDCFIGSNLMAGCYISKNAFLQVNSLGELFAGDQPYAFLAQSGISDNYGQPYAGQQAPIILGKIEYLSAEGIGNAIIWDDTMTSGSVGVVNSSARFIIGLEIGGIFATWSSFFKTTANNRASYAWVGAGPIDGLIIKNINYSSFWSAANGQGQLAAIHVANNTIGGLNGGVVLSGDFNTLTTNYTTANVPFIGGIPITDQLSTNYITVEQPGMWSGGVKYVTSSSNVTVGMLLDYQNTTNSLQPSGGINPVVGVAMQSINPAPSVSRMVIFANQGNAVPVQILGSNSVGMLIQAAAGGNGVTATTSTSGPFVGQIWATTASQNQYVNLMLGGQTAANIASITQAGIVQLNDTFTSTSKTQATTANVANTIWTTVQAAFAKANTGGDGGVVQNQFTFNATGGVSVNSGSTLTIVGNNTVVITGNLATTAASGVVQLNDTTLSTSASLAATANSVNTVWSYAQSAFILANSHTNLIASAFSEANGFQSIINSVFTLANSTTNLVTGAYALANSDANLVASAFTKANAAVIRAGDVMSGTLTTTTLTSQFGINTSSIVANSFITATSNVTGGNIVTLGVVNSKSVIVNTVNVGGTYTLGANDSGTIIVFNNTNPFTVTTSSSLFPGFRVVLTQVNTGMVTVTAGAGTTLAPRIPGNTAISSQNGSVSLMVWSPNTFLMDGAISGPIVFTSLNDTVTSQSTSLAATANSVNAVMLSSIQDSGDVMSGTLTTPNFTSNGTIRTDSLIANTTINATGNIFISGTRGFFAAQTTLGVGASGTTQGTATPINTQFSIITTSTATQGVVLPIPPVGTEITLINRTGSAVRIYPPSGHGIDSFGLNLNCNVAPTDGFRKLVLANSNHWYTTSNGVVGTS